MIGREEVESGCCVGWREVKEIYSRRKEMNGGVDADVCGEGTRDGGRGIREVGRLRGNKGGLGDNEADD